jgi:hypothetical protein
MPLFRKSRSSQINEMGPGDVLLAASGTLKQVEAQRIVQRAVLDDDVQLAARRLYDQLSNSQNQELLAIGNDVLLGCQRAASTHEGTRQILVNVQVESLLTRCRETLRVESREGGGDQESLLALATVRGVVRMLELRRPQQAARALGYGLGLVLYFTAMTFGALGDGVSERPRRHHAKWGKNGVTVELSTDGPTWRFDSEPDPYFDQLYAEAALAQMESAYGLDPSFPEAEKTLISLFASKPGESEGLDHTQFQLELNWDPPLPRVG